jgi:hypothetical protein
MRGSENRLNINVEHKLHEIELILQHELQALQANFKTFYAILDFILTEVCSEFYV